MSNFDKNSKFEIDTLNHIHNVREIGNVFCDMLSKRIFEHDLSKLNNKEEKELFKSILNEAEKSEYGSEEYKKLTEKLKPAIDLHYKNNAHHPEHFIDGINGMNLIDLVEMFIDWSAATKRHPNDDIHKSIEINKERFDIPDTLVNIFHNTAKDLFL